MAKAILKKIDLNRFTKVYPYARFEKREVYQTDGNFKVETGTLAFVEESGPKSYSFTQSYTSIPSVSAISVETTSNSNVNIYVTSISTTSVSFESSAPFTGDVSFTLVQVS